MKRKEMTDSERLRRFAVVCTNAKDHDACLRGAAAIEAQERLENVTRVVLVDDGGRAYERSNVGVTLSYQDGGRTLKVFVNRPDMSSAALTPARRWTVGNWDDEYDERTREEYYHQREDEVREQWRQEQEASPAPAAQGQEHCPRCKGEGVIRKPGRVDMCNKCRGFTCGCAECRARRKPQPSSGPSPTPLECVGVTQDGPVWNRPPQGPSPTPDVRRIAERLQDGIATRQEAEAVIAACAPTPDVREGLMEKLDARIGGLVNRGGLICAEFVPDPGPDGYTHSCHRCGYLPDVHLLRDCRAALRAPVSPPTCDGCQRPRTDMARLCSDCRAPVSPTPQETAPVYCIGPGFPPPPPPHGAREALAALDAEWAAAVYEAREDWTTDPHAHIERLIAAGDALLDALQPSPDTKEGR